jgi:hypothetical protein
MAYTAAQLAALEAAIAEGAPVASMTIGGTTFQFRDLADMERLRAQMTRELADAAGTRYGTRYAAHSKGV